MSSGANLDEPPPIPPPDFTPQSTSDFAKAQQPPLRGILVDKDYPPTAQDAAKAFPTSHASRPQAQSRQPRPDFESERDAEASRRVAEDVAKTLRRSSGATQVLNTAPQGNRGEVVNTMPGADTLQPGRGKFDTFDPQASQEAQAHSMPPQQRPKPTVSDGLKTVHASDFTSLHRQPCVRTSLLQGLTAGFVLGGIGYVSGRPVWRSTNFAVYGFVGTSVGSYSYCQIQRNREREGMKAAVRIVEQKKEDKRRAYEERKKLAEERTRLAKEKEEEERIKLEKARSWWKFWQGSATSGEKKE